MKIGIDARFLTHPQVGGFKTYSQNLINALAEIDSNNEYIIYLDRPPDDVSLVQQENFTYRVVKAYIPGLRTAVREQFHLPRAIGRDRPDVVHFLCNTAPVNVHDVPFVLTLHDTIQVTAVESFPLTLNLGQYKSSAISVYSKWTIEQTTSKATKIVTVSNYEKSEIAAHLDIDKEDIHVTHLAPNPIFKPADRARKAVWRQELRHDLDLPERFILGIGYEPRKNINLLIEAFSNIAPDHPGLSLVVVAAQDEARQNFKLLATDLELDDRIVVLDGQSQAILNRLYNLAEIFVFPSERESFGLPPLEAMACGVPVLASNSSSIPEIVGDAAIIFNTKDNSAIRDAISRVLLDQELQSELKSKGLARAAMFSWKKCAQDTLAVYRKVLEIS